MPIRKPHAGPWFVYVLRDPRDAAVRYVGATKLAPEARLRAHFRDPRRIPVPKMAWLIELEALGMRPAIEVVETVLVGGYPAALLKEAEWIERMAADGADLLNVRNRTWTELSPDHPGRQLRVFARANGLTDETLGQRFGVSGGTVGTWGDGVARPSMVNRAKIEDLTRGAIPVRAWGAPTKTGPKPGSKRRRWISPAPTQTAI